ncbi:nucleoside-diphosphate kinase [Candidatus Pacearchaeota archaeon]|nr:nucleoside-diphosphate kinase [Candidatus Pacearchaeota archaeon]
MIKLIKEKTLVLIKPDGIIRNLIGRIIMRFEDAGLKIIGMKMVWVDGEFAGKHYRKDIGEKHGERVRDGLIKYIKEGPVVAMVLEGVDAINVARKLIGGTYPNDSSPGTIRGDFAHISKDYANSNEITVRNLIHASANKEDAQIEIPLWFDKEELHSYKTVHDIVCFEE